MEIVSVRLFACLTGCLPWIQALSNGLAILILPKGRMRLLLPLLMSSLMSVTTTPGQSIAFGIKATGLAIHPKKRTNARLYQTTLDSRGYLVLNGGITLTAELNIYRKLGLKLAQAILWRDCAGKFAALSHIGINIGGGGSTLGNTNHGLSGSIGPMIYWRESWQGLPGYQADRSWLKKPGNSRWETKIIPIGGQVEYNYYFSKQYAAAVNILPGYPDVISVTAGITTRW